MNREHIATWKNEESTIHDNNSDKKRGTENEKEKTAVKNDRENAAAENNKKFHYIGSILANVYPQQKGNLAAVNMYFQNLQY